MKQTAQPHEPDLLVRRLSSAATAIASAAIGAVAKRNGPPLLPFNQWPAWARDTAQSRQPEDTGLGDTLVHIIGDARSEKFKQWFTRKFGKSCGCAERQRWLNQQYPYSLVE
jgi:hypothetical protein